MRCGRADRQLFFGGLCAGPAPYSSVSICTARLQSDRPQNPAFFRLILREGNAILTPRIQRRKEDGIMANDKALRAVDLTCPATFSRHLPPECRESRLELKSAATRYTGVVYDLRLNGMSGSYIDFPGHIAETDDGRRADNVDLTEFYRMDATVIHVDRTEKSGGITGAELEAVCGGVPNTPAIIIHSMGPKDPPDINFRSSWLTMDAVEWLIAAKCRILVSSAKRTFSEIN